ncbi:MAG: hypothetical protein IPK63_23440 [Candidatus Competibacteraceae bacterium]|nr:hypothetical protein [Candidatus Competibacteraceae bacterium]
MIDNDLRLPQQDDEDWLNLLAGRTVPNADSRTRQEAEALRQAILSQPISPIHELSAAELTQGRERLLFALQRATSSQSWWKRPALLSGLAALVGIALLPMIISHHESSATLPTMSPFNHVSRTCECHR